MLRASILTALLVAVQPASAQRQMDSPEPFRISPGDTLQVDVWKEPEASSPAVMVRPDGRISLPIVGEVKVSGLTPEDLRKDLAVRYGVVIRDPRVTVVVKQFVVPKVYVIGEVRREGAVRMETPLTVLQALAESGGVTDFAKRRKIYILRVAQNGRRLIIPFDFDAVVRGDNMDQNILLQPADTIVVPR